MWINNLEFEILKRIKYELSLDNIGSDKNQILEILNKLKNFGIITFKRNVENHELINPINFEITQKGDRIFTETNYEPS
jgi:Cdc6-like AAA superfamily ATPase